MGIIHKVDNIFGGHTYYQDGEVVGRSVENIFGGETIYTDDGEVAARTTEDITGGETIYTYEDDDDFHPRRERERYFPDDKFFEKFRRVGGITDEMNDYQ